MDRYLGTLERIIVQSRLHHRLYIHKTSNKEMDELQGADC